jgi:hypothetical protein
MDCRGAVPLTCLDSNGIVQLSSPQGGLNFALDPIMQPRCMQSGGLLVKLIGIFTSTTAPAVASTCVLLLLLLLLLLLPPASLVQARLWHESYHLLSTSLLPVLLRSQQPRRSRGDLWRLDPTPLQLQPQAALRSEAAMPLTPPIHMRRLQACSCYLLRSQPSHFQKHHNGLRAAVRCCQRHDHDWPQQD